MTRSKEEQQLLSKLASGVLDGPVGSEKVYHGYKDVTVGKFIRDGIPVSYREGASSKFFNGKENERIVSRRQEEYYESDEDKLLFLQKYGWLMDDEEVRAYSAKYKPEKG